MIYFFEDVVVGWKHEFGDIAVTREDVLDFAARFDPQPFHMDDTAAATTHFERVVASGWHSCAMAMRMLVDHWRDIPGWQTAAMGALGIDAVRFTKPVYPGDRLRSSWEILEKRESQSRPDMGIIRSRHEIFGRSDAMVLSFESIVGHRRRPRAEPLPG